MVMCIWLLSMGCTQKLGSPDDGDSAIVASENADSIPNEIISMEYRSMTVAALNRIDVLTSVRTALCEMPEQA